MRNRDPRHRAHQAKVAQHKAVAQELQQLPSGIANPPTSRPTPSATDLRAAKEREDARMRAAAEFDEQHWQRIKEDELCDEEDLVEEGDGTGQRIDDGLGGEAFECVACGKTFRSEASWENHERSKKHKQAVWRSVLSISV